MSVDVELCSLCKEMGLEIFPSKGEGVSSQGVLLPSALWQGNTPVGLLLAHVSALF